MMSLALLLLVLQMRLLPLLVLLVQLLLVGSARAHNQCAYIQSVHQQN
jgi:hypothetical protein